MLATPRPSDKGIREVRRSRRPIFPEDRSTLRMFPAYPYCPRIFPAFKNRQDTHARP